MFGRAALFSYLVIPITVHRRRARHLGHVGARGRLCIDMRFHVALPELPFELIFHTLAQADGLRVLHIAACTSRVWHRAAERVRRSWKLLYYLDSRKRDARAPKLRYPCAMIELAGRWPTLVVAEEQHLVSCMRTERDPQLFGTLRHTHVPPRLRGSDGPSGVVLYSPDGGPKHLFVSDAGRDVVCRFSLAPWKWECEFGGFGTEGGRLISPGDLCIIDHSLYVAEAHSISIFALPETSSGSSSATPTFVSKFGSHGTALGEFRKGIGGLAASPDVLDGGAHLFACDTGNHRVQVFTATGALVCAFGRKGESAGEFNKPAAIALVMTGVEQRPHGAARVVVGETVGKRIQVLSAVGVPLQLVLTLPVGLSAGPSRGSPAPSASHWEIHRDLCEGEGEPMRARVGCFAYDARGQIESELHRAPLLYAASASSDAMLHVFGVVCQHESRGHVPVTY